MLKYQELVERAARKLGKDVEFDVLTPEVELDPALIQRMDEALVHILRNALAHGIEDGETRARRGKGRGRIRVAYSRHAGMHAISVQDDGGGIDGEALAAKAAALGLITGQEAARLGPEEKVRLLFESGLSTAPGADSISGRGQGMAIAWERMRAAKGDLTVETWAGAGTRFTLTVPDPGPGEPAPAENPARSRSLAA
jgi:two-component system chemotaxis sensor kinase CheA